MDNYFFQISQIKNQISKNLLLTYIILNMPYDKEGKEDKGPTLQITGLLTHLNYQCPANIKQ